jgi:hypothetical protein
MKRSRLSLISCSDAPVTSRKFIGRVVDSHPIPTSFNKSVKQIV